MPSNIIGNYSCIQNEMNQLFQDFISSTEISNSNGLTKDELNSLGKASSTIGGPSFFKALFNEFEKLDKNDDGRLTGDEVPTVNAYKVEGSELSIENTAVKSDKSSNPNNPITNINLNNATLGQVLIASQALGLGNVSGYLETMSTDTDGSSAAENVLKNSTIYNIPALLENWASFDETHGAKQGANQLRSIEKTLLANSDNNGNILIDTKTYNSIADMDTSSGNNNSYNILATTKNLTYSQNTFNKILEQYGINS